MFKIKAQLVQLTGLHTYSASR